jgi:hypothetical protein
MTNGYWGSILALSLFALFAWMHGPAQADLPAKVALARTDDAAQVKPRWAFERLGRVEPPADDSDWSANPIDRFVMAKLRPNGLLPSAPLDKQALLRRVTFDLLGLPPGPQDIARFLEDNSPAAYATVVDRLLSSPGYGERWGRHWLDVVRYADTGGFEVDHLYPNAWRFRDYVIRSFNSGKPLDRFIQEQVAGDELWPRDSEASVATSLYTIGPALSESAMVANQLENEWLTDAADTTGATFLGLTVGCARCHDHKYDPISQKDYYALQAIFAASDRPFPEKFRLVRIKALNGLLSEVPLPKALEQDPRCMIETEASAGMGLFHRREPLIVHRLRRGEISKPAEIVNPDFPQAFRTTQPERGLQSTGSTHRRARLAEWLTSPENPLTARVLVNRIWAWHFGQGIVRTPNDFGAQGEPPTHPELLDWLARDFIDHGWDLKRLHRLILLSNTYQMQSVADPGQGKLDPENRLLGHFPRQRLEGEVIRDAMLWCSGALNLETFGPPVVPLLSGQELTGLFDAKLKWQVTKDSAAHTRRSIYLLERRTFIYPLFAAFDPPEVMSSCAQRTRTILPAQALTLLNSPVTREQAAIFARRLLKECGNEPERIVARAWQLGFGRPPQQTERERALAFLRQSGAAIKALADRSNDSLEVALAELCLALFNANEFIYVD